MFRPNVKRFHHGFIVKIFEECLSSKRFQQQLSVLLLEQFACPRKLVVLEALTLIG